MRIILSHTARALSILVLTLVTGDTSVSYGQDAPTRSYNIVDSQNQILDIPGMGQQKIETTTTIDIDVWKTGDRQYSLTITDFTIDGPQLPGADLASLIGLESDITLADDGTVESASGLAENAAIISIGGEAAFRNRLQSLFLQGPGNGMSVGKKWSRTDTTPSDQGGLSVERVVKSDYTCVGEEELDGTEVWVIDVETDLELTGSGSQGGQSMEMEMAGGGSGKMYIDKATLMLVSANQEAEIEGTIDMDMGSILMTMQVLNTITSSAGYEP